MLNRWPHPKMLQIQLFIITLYALFAYTVANDAPTVTIRQGKLIGKLKESTEGRQFSAFTGIPYAKPPIGELRFEAPVPADPWNGVLNATQPHAICPQMNVVFGDEDVKGNEDCLYLNVYTPEVTAKNLPVIFYVHCGGFIWGTANSDFFGPEHFLDQDVVIVSVNYRLGALGFLSTGDEIVPGNNGLKDQNLALQWTWNNIKEFGGDPKSITVFGQSAGAASAHYHMISPLSKDYVKRIIANSGTVFSPWALSRNLETETNSRKLANFLNCPSERSKEMITCLKKVDAHSIINQEQKFYLSFQYWSFIPIIPFKPVIETITKGGFLTRHPIDILQSGNAANVPFLTGIVSEEGVMLTAAALRDGLMDNLLNDFENLSPKIFFYNSSRDVTSKIKNFYFKNDNLASGLTKSMSDNWFGKGADVSVRIHKKVYTAPVYYYLFQYRGSKSFSEILGLDMDYGVCHCDDLIYLLSTDLLDKTKATQNDNIMRRIMVNMWVNFAKTGNPTFKKVEAPKPIEWKPVTTDHAEYLSIKDPSNITMQRNLYTDRYNLWNQLPILNNEYKLIKDEL